MSALSIDAADIGILADPRPLSMREQLDQVHRRVRACHLRMIAALEDLQAEKLSLLAGDDGATVGINAALAEYRAQRTRKLALIQRQHDLTRLVARAERLAGRLVPGATSRPAAPELRAP